MFSWVLADADEKAARGEPFYDFVMTVSNHRPYTYPEGRIDIPSHSGRAGAIKYTDYAIGKFIEAARQRPWFKDTIFVIVSDHCAGSAGKTALPIKNYHIPLMVYAPGIIEPARVDTLSRQIDYAPTLFGLMNWSYESEFYGKNILTMAPADERALIGTYQSLGLLHGDLLTLLRPVGITQAFEYDAISKEQIEVPIDDARVLETIAYYQSAADGYEAHDSTSTDVVVALAQ